MTGLVSILLSVFVFLLFVIAAVVAVLVHREAHKNDLRPWNTHDEALLTALTWREAIRRGEPPAAGQPESARVTMCLGEGERELAQGTYKGCVWGVEGDGSYVRSTTLEVRGYRVVASESLTDMALNWYNQSRAIAAATPHWITVATGGLVVTSLGVYFEQRDGTWVGWAWANLTGVRVSRPGSVEVSFGTDEGAATELLVSIHAELVFLAWAAAVHPDHPQLVGDSWLPPGWVDFARAHGRLPAHASIET